MIYLKKHGGYCDFCGAEAGEFAKTDCDAFDGMRERDVCRECVLQAAEQFGMTVSASRPRKTPFGAASV